MGSLCTGTPAKTETSSIYRPAGGEQLQDIWNRVSSAASTPYTAYGGQRVADINDVQRGGIGNIVGATGDLNTARGYAAEGASPISEGDISRYYNPFQRDVIDATQRNFAESNAQADERMKGNSIARGAWGGDRANIGRAELMRQQKIAQDPVIAGLNSQGFNLALSAAQADRAAKAQGSYQFGSLGNSAVGQGQSQIGAGSLMQGTDQARLNALYDQFQQQQAFPYQQAQFLAQTGLPAVSAMGGSQTGNTTSYAAEGSPLSKGIGAAMAIGSIAAAPFTGGMSLMGLQGASGMMSGATGSTSGNGFSSSGTPGYYGGSPSNNPNLMPFKRGGRIGYSRGGRTRRIDHGDFAERVNSIREMLRGGRVMETQRDPNGIYVPMGYADGGDVDIADRWGPFTPYDAGDGAGSLDAARAMMSLQNVPPSAMDAWRQSNDVALNDAPSLVPDAGRGSNIASLPPFMRPQPADLPPSAMAFSGTPMPQARPDMATVVPPAAAPAPMPPMPVDAPSPAPAPRSFGDDGNGNGNPFGISEEARMGFLTAGLGMMASNNPSALGAIGEGGLKGVQQYADAKKSRQSNDLAARKLIQDAQNFAQGIDVRERTLAETAQHHQALEERENQKMIGTNEEGFPVFRDSRTGKETIGATKLQGKAPSGYVRNPDGTMSAIKGGPQDPEQLAAVAKAKQTGALLPDDTADFLAERVLAGDARALIGLGRGAQGAENITKIQTLAARKASDRGMSPTDVLAKVAEQSGLTAQQRTFGTQIAKMAVNSTEAQGAIELGREASAAVPRTNWIPINKLIQAGQVITSDPKLIQFAAANLAIVNTYARAISPTGVPTVHDKEHAEKLLSTATGPEGYSALLDQMNKEIEIAHAAPLKAKKELEAIRKAPSTSTAAPAGAPSAVPPGAIDLLRKDPSLAEKFDQKYGPGAAKRALGN